MTKIALITDSSNDLPPEILARYNIGVVPLIIHLGSEELPGTGENREIFWERVAQGATPRTAAPSIGAFQEAFATALTRADEVIAVTLTGKHSSTYHIAQLAAAEFDGRVHVFDSWAISLGVGLQVLRAAQLAEQGASVSAILADLEERRNRFRISLYLDTLDAIQRGGRIALAMNAIKGMSSILSVKVILHMVQGELKFAGVVRSAKKGMRHIVNSFSGSEIEELGVAHTRVPARAQQLADMASETLDFPREDILVAEAGPILGVHGGSGAFGVIAFTRKSK